MFFPISGTHISPIYLVIVGFTIGILGGFFGVGGSFIAGPALRLVGVDWNFAVGTDLAHIVGKSAVAVRRHRALGNVDLKLGLVMALGTIAGAEAGAQLIQMLSKNAQVAKGTSAVGISKRREVKKRPFRIRSGDPCHSTIENLADDRVANFGNKSDFALDDSSGRVRGRVIQRLSRRRRRLHPHAFDGLRARDSYASRSRHRSF
ncbi:MAG: hypothetical protein DME62_12200 [Verrucomicrobia bacterium]|nr:MAG: hypothetical protein DME62_12200 [Verrucomicrobiota bacterium]